MIRDADAYLACRERGDMHSWPGQADFCADCGIPWVSFVADKRMEGTEITRDDTSIRARFVGDRPVAMAWLRFAPSVLDDPEQLASFTEEARRHAAGSSRVERPERLVWEPPVIGPVVMRREEVDGDAAGDRTPVDMACVIVFGRFPTRAELEATA